MAVVKRWLQSSNRQSRIERYDRFYRGLMQTRVFAVLVKVIALQYKYSTMLGYQSLKHKIPVIQNEICKCFGGFDCLVMANLRVCFTVFIGFLCCCACPSTS